MLCDQDQDQLEDITYYFGACWMNRGLCYQFLYVKQWSEVRSWTFFHCSFLKSSKYLSSHQVKVDD